MFRENEVQFIGGGIVGFFKGENDRGPLEDIGASIRNHSLK